MDNMKDNTYYKYRNLKDFERFLDVVINNRMYGAKPRELNDPMEGKFNKTNLSQDDFKEIRNELKNTRICSLLTKQKDQTFPNDYLMWSHYADSHNGCCIEVQITGRYNTGWELHEIQYQNNMPSLDGLSGNKRIQRILTVKTPIWESEHEVRAIRVYEDKKINSLSPYYHVNIKAVYFGCRVTLEKCRFYKRIINGVNPAIKIYKVKEDNTRNDVFAELTCSEIK